MIRLAGLVIVGLLAATAIANAADYGPRRGVREVRAAVPTLVHARLDLIRPGDVAVVDTVVVGRDNAIAEWHGLGGRGTSVLTYRNATWWLVGSAYEVRDRDTWFWTTDNSTAQPGCIITAYETSPPDAELLRASLHADEATIALWEAHARRLTSKSAGSNVIVGAPADRYCSGPATGRDASGFALYNPDGYRATWTSSAADWSTSLVTPRGRAPTDAEMSGPGANSIVYLYASGSPSVMTFPKSSLTIWCPFVLDPEVHYIVEFSGADGRLGPIRGTLDDNTLTFEIPAFTAPANADLRGEVDYLPYREH